ncbi:MAG TPA: lipocalin family protein [Niastella sp.]
MKKYVLALISISFIIYGCDKDDDDKGNSEKEKIALITSATWKYDTVGIDNNKDGKPDQALPPGFEIEKCETDNTITFKSDSTGVLNEGATKCDINDPQTTPFTWWLKENGSVLYSPNPIFSSDLNGDFKLGEVTTSRLRVIKDVSFAPFGTYTIVLDLKH